ncbi:hypothetical protein [Comamonas composti]|uniref:hypothetical protein n=1 Tax=Comamonas composti TaxID=408558 RepID=UPI000421B144|nr:hypothetical protein [Comamonas composti]
MDAMALANHWLNFLAPAFFMALALVLCARFFWGKSAAALYWWVQAAINMIVGSLLLLGGLWWFGSDGKMATYAALVLGMGLGQWLLSRGWR